MTIDEFNEKVNAHIKRINEDAAYEIVSHEVVINELREDINKCFIMLEEGE